MVVFQPYSVADKDRTGKASIHYCAENQNLNCIEQVSLFLPLKPSLNFWQIVTVLPGGIKKDNLFMTIKSIVNLLTQLGVNLLYKDIVRVNLVLT